MQFLKLKWCTKVENELDNAMAKNFKLYRDKKTLFHKLRRRFILRIFIKYRRCKQFTGFKKVKGVYI